MIQVMDFISTGQNTNRETMRKSSMSPVSITSPFTRINFETVLGKEDPSTRDFIPLIKRPNKKAVVSPPGRKAVPKIPQRRVAKDQLSEINPVRDVDPAKQMSPILINFINRKFTQRAVSMKSVTLQEKHDLTVRDQPNSRINVTNQLNKFGNPKQRTPRCHN